MALSALAPDFKERPYWWEGAQTLGRGSCETPGALNVEADVVVVGAGLTGMAAARVLADAGRQVIVLDAGEPGSGASSRNGGMLGRYFKHSFGELLESRGLETARAYFTELKQVYDGAIAMIETDALDCDYRRCGRFVGAVTPDHRDRLFREWELRARHVGEEVVFVEQATPEVASGRYHGGVHIVDNAAVQPARYFEALRRLAERAGALVIGHCAVTAIARGRDCFEIATARGTIRAGDVLVATNGYSGGDLPWFASRLSPINAFMVATEPLEAGIARSLLPENRTYHDNRRNSNYFQLSPDGTRLIFGGRTGLSHVSLRSMAERLSEEMVFFFPQLRGVRVSHAWTGRCAATQDLFPHAGIHDGIHYALGYCFSGLAMAPYLGAKAAQRILGRKEAATLFQADALRKMPWLARQEYLMPLAMQYFRWKDRISQTSA